MCVCVISVCVESVQSYWYLVRLSSGWGLLPLLRSQRDEAESREGSAEQDEEVELRLG